MKYKIIKSIDQYNSYSDILENLILKDPEKTDEIELLTLLLEHYNKQLMENYPQQQDPVTLLHDLITDHQMTQKELAQKLDLSDQLISDILHYRRTITKTVALKLGDIFKIQFHAFLQPYALVKAG